MLWMGIALAVPVQEVALLMTGESVPSQGDDIVVEFGYTASRHLGDDDDFTLVISHTGSGAATVEATLTGPGHPVPVRRGWEIDDGAWRQVLARLIATKVEAPPLVGVCFESGVVSLTVRADHLEVASVSVCRDPMANAHGPDVAVPVTADELFCIVAPAFSSSEPVEQFVPRAGFSATSCTAS